MEAIINGLRYSTRTAEQLCRLPCASARGDFEWHSTHLYRAPAGRFFIAGEGGALSVWAQPVGRGSSSGGGGLRLVTPEQAREYMEAAGCSAAEFEAAGFTIGEG